MINFPQILIIPVNYSMTAILCGFRRRGLLYYCCPLQTVEDLHNADSLAGSQSEWYTAFQFLRPLMKRPDGYPVPYQRQAWHLGRMMTKSRCTKGMSLGSEHKKPKTCLNGVVLQATPYV